MDNIALAAPPQNPKTASREYSRSSVAPPCAIEVRGAQVRYAGAENVALEIERLDLARGVRTALVGPNGAGKSTLLKAIIGLVPLCGGAISLSQNEEEPPREYSHKAGETRRRIAYVPQGREVDWSFPVTVFDVALMGRDVHLGFAHRPQKRDMDAAREALETMKMSEYSRRPISALSGGQKQRVFLSRALAQSAEVLLLDEPFLGVDAASEEVILRVMKELADEGVTVVVATHDLTTLEANYDHAILLKSRVIAQGTPRDITQPNLLAAAYGGPLALFQERDACHHA